MLLLLFFGMVDLLIEDDGDISYFMLVSIVLDLIIIDHVKHRLMMHLNLVGLLATA